MDITGRWTVIEYSNDDEWHAVEFRRNSESEHVVGANAEHEPWIEIGEDLRGYPGGCNEFYVEYFIDGNALSFGQSGMTSMACHPSDLEDAFQTILALEDAIRVEVDGEAMNWSTSDASFRFVRGDSR